MKKCPFCAEPIQDEAILCRYCGRAILPAPPIPSVTLPSPTGSSAQLHSYPLKKPWLAVALNLLLLVMGLGYVYLGLWKRFLVVLTVQLLSLAPMTFLGLREYNKYLLFGVWLFTLIDVKRQALAHNARVSHRPAPALPRSPGEV